MNLKIEDLEKEMSLKRGSQNNDNGNSNHDLMSMSGYSITSASFVHASMKEALANSQHGHVGSQKGNLVKDDNNSKSKNNIQAAGSDEPPKEYEKMLQKLESDIRGHIRVSYL